MPSDADSTSTREALPAGSPQRWVIRSGHRVRSWRTLITVILLIIMGSAAGAFTLALEHSALAAIESETDLHQVASELHRIDALEWRLSAGSATPDEVRVRLAASSAVIEHLLADAAAEQLHPTETESLRRDFALYRDALEREIRFIEHGVDQQAREVDAFLVDPLFESLVSAIAQYNERLRADAERQSRTSDIGILLTLATLLGICTWILDRRVRSDVQHRAEHEAGARYRALIDQSSDLVMVVDPTGHPSFVSPSAERFLAQHPTGRPGPGLLDVVHAEDRDLVRERLADLRAGAGLAALSVRLGSGHSWRDFELAAEDLTAEPSVQGIVITAHDVTERQALQSELTHQAMHDGLTGLPNRVLLAQRVEEALGTDDLPASALLLIDLDRFKEVNDTLGHHIGDQLLVQIGRRLDHVVRPGDTIARLGGDEFAVLLVGVASQERACAIARRALDSLTQPFRIEGLDLQVEASIGVVLSGEHGEDVPTLMQRADIAMYVAKARGIGVFAYDPDTDDHHPERLALLGDLRRALDGDELLIHVQPQVSLSSGELIGVEALVRWQHPERGLVFPDDFLPVAEHTGLIMPLTARVLELAVRQARRWIDAGTPTPISVNLSARNLLDDELAAGVAQLLHRHAVPAELLVLEVTESAIMSEPARATEVLRELTASGLRIAIDDFGVGFTSLAQLRDLPLYELKIDRSFVMTMAEDRSNDVIVRSMLDLGHNLGLRTVAEGVENPATMALLRAYGCDIVQGYHLARPLPIEAFDTWRGQHLPWPVPGTRSVEGTPRTAPVTPPAQHRNRQGADG